MNRKNEIKNLIRKLGLRPRASFKNQIALLWSVRPTWEPLSRLQSVERWRMCNFKSALLIFIEEAGV